MSTDEPILDDEQARLAIRLEGITRMSFMFEILMMERDDNELLNQLLELIEQKDPYMMIDLNKGPRFMALTRYFGFIKPWKGREKLESTELDPELVIRVLTEWEKYQLLLGDLNNGHFGMACMEIEEQQV